MYIRKNESIENEDKYDNRVTTAICIYIIATFFDMLSLGFESVLGYDVHSMVAILCKSIIAVSIIVCLPSIIGKKIKKNIIIYTVIIIFVSVIQYTFFQSTWKFYKEYLITHLTTIYPVVLLFLVVKDYKRLLNKLIYSAYIVSIILLLIFILFIGKLFRNYSMSFATSMIFPTDLLIYYFFNNNINIKIKNKFFTLILIVSNIIIVAAFGSRGALIAILFYLLFCFIHFKPKNKKSIIIRAFILVTLLVFSIYFKQIIITLINLLRNFGISSRTLQLFVYNTTFSSGRAEIWNEMREAILKSPITIKGIAADCLVTGNYSHNVILELLYEFNIFNGFFILIYIMHAGIKTLFYKKDSEYIVLKQMLFLGAFPILFWTGTIWSYVSFWLFFIGMPLKKKNIEMT